MTQGPGIPGLHIHLLGRFEVRAGDRLIIDRSWHRRKAVALLKLLALQKGRSLHREQVFDSLWRHLTPSAAANNLRKNLHYLRTAFAQRGITVPVVSATGDMVILSPEFSIDLDGFRSQAQIARGDRNDPRLYEQALALYTGDLLPEEIYEDWTEPQREELRTLRIQLLTELSRLNEARGQAELAAESLQHLLQADPLHEEAHRSLMRLYAQAGNRDRALRQYQSCRNILQRELGVEPSAETEALHREILEGPVALLDRAPTPAGAPRVTEGLGAGAAGVDAFEKRKTEERRLEPQPRSLTRLWAKPAFRLTALAFVLAAIGGGVAGGLVLYRAGLGGGPPAIADFREVVNHHTTQARAQRISGDCQSEDMIVKGISEGDVTGDISGRITATSETTIYSAEGCRLALAKATATITDNEGNSLFFTSEAPAFISRLPEAGVSGIRSASTITITDGTGVYKGATGKGTCATVSVSKAEPDGSTAARSEADCNFQLATAGAAVAAGGPLIVQLAASPTDVTVFGGSVKLPATVAVIALYRNTRNQTQKGLSLRLAAPQGAQILAAARSEKQPISAGERIWRLPDLPPGALHRFEFTLQFLAADTVAIPLVVEIMGEGFRRPVTNDPITLRVVQ